MTHATSRAEVKRQPVVIGLVNNMGDAALRTTEEQFRDLLGRAGASYDVRLRLFSFPELIRSEAAAAYVAAHYESIAALWSSEVDALIVTGAEPRTASLPDEAYWPSLTRVVDWATECGVPTIWSCLAAHAAVQYLDGVERRPLDAKLSGVFRCRRVADDAITAGLPETWHVPHSRLNALDADQLSDAGYEIMSYSAEAGVDTFIRRRHTLFMFFQGHPEYDADALFREYRRDVGRYLAGTVEQYPEMPRGYFDGDTARVLKAFRARARRQRARELLDEFPAVATPDRHPSPWRDVSVRLYRNWVAAAAERDRHVAIAASSANAVS
ncbi:MAG: homoserine O-succinyltransferase [Gemmatimonadaceae bacterium]